MLRLARITFGRSIGLVPVRGATAVEYALVASLIAVVIFGAMAYFGRPVLALFQPAASSV